MIPKHNKPDNTDLNANRVEEDKDVASKYSDEIEKIVPVIKVQYPDGNADKDEKG
jgi:hypothetical protein